MKLFNHFYRRVIKNNRGELSTAMALLYGSGIAAGGGILGGLLGKKKSKDPIITQLPDYKESTGAREDWWSKLQNWGADPNYGAITPDWADIWQNAQDKVRQYYWGSPTKMGLAGKVKASAAKRGVSDSAALDANLTAMGAEEGNQLSTMATEQGVAKANLANQGRTTWLSSLMNLAGLKPSYNVSPNTSSNYGVGNMIGDVTGAIGSGITQYGMAKQQNDWLSKLIQLEKTKNWMNSLGATTQSGLTDKDF